MTTAAPLLLITADPSTPLAHLALRYARAWLSQNPTPKDNTALEVFFYAEAAHTANQLRWQSADQADLTKAWQAVAKAHQLALPVCVSTALSRGVSDADNSARHQLAGDNVATGFTLVGLSELALRLQGNRRVLTF